MVRALVVGRGGRDGREAGLDPNGRAVLGHPPELDRDRVPGRRGRADASGVEPRPNPVPVLGVDGRGEQVGRVGPPAGVVPEQVDDVVADERQPQPRAVDDRLPDDAGDGRDQVGQPPLALVSGVGQNVPLPLEGGPLGGERPVVGVGPGGGAVPLGLHPAGGQLVHPPPQHPHGPGDGRGRPAQHHQPKQAVVRPLEQRPGLGQVDGGEGDGGRGGVEPGRRPAAQADGDHGREQEQARRDVAGEPLEQQVDPDGGRHDRRKAGGTDRRRRSPAAVDQHRLSQGTTPLKPRRSAPVGDRPPHIAITRYLADAIGEPLPHPGRRRARLATTQADIAKTLSSAGGVDHPPAGAAAGRGAP